MLTGLLKLVGGSTGAVTEAIIPKKAGKLQSLGTVIEGVTDPRFVAIYRALIERGGYSFDLRHGGLSERANSTITQTRQQMAEARAWQHRPDVDPWRVLDCEHFICSSQYLPSCSCVHLIILTRAGREGPFNELERRVVALFHSELGRLWRHTEEDADGHLPAYLQPTLTLLLEGSSEKQIAERMGLSMHTVHDHVKRLYRRFEVKSRGQLLARLAHSPLLRAPRLCVNLLNNGNDHQFDSEETAGAGPWAAAPAFHSKNPGRRASQA